MTPEVGQLALWLALAVAAVQGSLPLAGAARGRADWMALARPAAQTQSRGEGRTAHVIEHRKIKSGDDTGAFSPPPRSASHARTKSRPIR